jgi:hypothetical protein
LAFTGSFAFAFPVIGRLYLAGDQGVLAIARTSFFTGAATGIPYPSGLIGSIGSIHMGITIRRSVTLPKWAGVFFALHTPLLTSASAFSYPLEMFGGLSLFVSPVRFAPAMWRRASSAASMPQMQHGRA